MEDTVTPAPKTPANNPEPLEPVARLQQLAGSKNTYILSDSLDDRKRLEIQVKLYTPAFRQTLSMAFDKSDLRDRLRDPQATFRVLDLGCGEGLYFPVLAQFLVEQGMRSHLEMVGLDRDARAISTGQDYVWALNMNNVKLYVHDLTKPLNQVVGLTATASSDQDGRFDLIYANVVLMHVPQIAIKLVLGQIHDELLKPGGAFFTKDMTWGAGGMSYPSPSFTKLSGTTAASLLKMLGGDFAPQHEAFLSEAGFEGIESFEDFYPIGGSSETGRKMLSDFILGQYATRPMLTKLGIMNEAEYDELVRQEFQELKPELEGRLTLKNTLAYRPKSE